MAAVATGGVALLAGGAAMAAFKFSPSINKESSQMSREDRQRELEVFRKVRVHRRWLTQPKLYHTVETKAFFRF